MKSSEFVTKCFFIRALVVELGRRPVVLTPIGDEILERIVRQSEAKVDCAL